MSKKKKPGKGFNPSPDDLWLIQCRICMRVSEFVPMPKAWREVSSDEVAKNAIFVEAICGDCDNEPKP